MPKELHVLASAVVIVAALLGALAFADLGAAAGKSGLQPELQAGMSAEAVVINR